MKVIALTLVAALIIGSSSAEKLRKSDKNISLEAPSSKTTEDEAITEITDSDVDKKDKEVHKRGIFHYGTLATHVSPWPKSYAAHYGYGLHLPASTFSASPLTAVGHIHAPVGLKYNTGFHYKALSSPYVPAAAAVQPTLSTLSPPVPHVHHAHAATSTPFVIRPGGAVVQSYSVNYPHHQPAVALKPVSAYAPVAAPHPVQHVQPVHTIQSVPVQPVQSVVKVQHLKPFVDYEHSTQQFPPYFQTFFQSAPVPAPAVPTSHVPTISPAFPAITSFSAAPAVPVAPHVTEIPLTQVQHAFPAIPSFTNRPTFPSIPAVPETPAVPVVPNVPAFPSIPDISHNQQPQFTNNGFFPLNVQPPLPQQPPTFVNYNPTAHGPGLVPVVGTPNQNNPDFGSAEAAPSIPQNTPQAHPSPDLPAAQPQPTQQPWKPVLYQPPTVDNSGVNRPSNTLLPPYGSSPAEGYLPPAPSTKQKLQQEFNINSQLFDNLSDADIQHIFHQANIAAQNDHNHAHDHAHTVHTYHSHY